MGKSRFIDTLEFRHLYPFTSHYLDVNGLKYHYIDEGSGDPIIMIHGNPTWSFYYRTLITSLSSQYRTIAPDHIGCGLSQKPDEKIYDYRLSSRVADLEALMGHLDLKRNITLVLHDWGGMIGMACAVKNPLRIGRIIILNTAAFLPPRGKRLPLRLRLVRNFTPLAAIAVLGFNLFSYGAMFMASHQGLKKEVKLGLTAPYNSWKNRIATLKFVQDIPLTDKDPSFGLVGRTDQNLKSLRDVPMLICWGQRDFVFDGDYLNEWRRRFPKAEVHTFSAAGHYILEDEPDGVLQRVENFLIQNPLS
jgi:haloalkane dehalogenase